MSWFSSIPLTFSHLFLSFSLSLPLPSFPFFFNSLETSSHYPPWKLSLTFSSPNILLWLSVHLSHPSLKCNSLREDIQNTSSKIAMKTSSLYTSAPLFLLYFFIFCILKLLYLFFSFTVSLSQLECKFLECKKSTGL